MAALETSGVSEFISSARHSANSAAEQVVGADTPIPGPQLQPDLKTSRRDPKRRDRVEKSTEPAESHISFVSSIPVPSKRLDAEVVEISMQNKFGALAEMEPDQTLVQPKGEVFSRSDEVSQEIVPNTSEEPEGDFQVIAKKSKKDAAKSASARAPKRHTVAMAPLVDKPGPKPPTPPPAKATSVSPPPPLVQASYVPPEQPKVVAWKTSQPEPTPLSQIQQEQLKDPLLTPSMGPDARREQFNAKRNGREHTASPEPVSVAEQQLSSSVSSKSKNVPVERVLKGKERQSRVHEVVLRAVVSPVNAPESSSQVVAEKLALMAIGSPANAPETSSQVVAEKSSRAVTEKVVSDAKTDRKTERQRADAPKKWSKVEKQSVVQIPLQQDPAHVVSEPSKTTLTPPPEGTKESEDKPSASQSARAVRLDNPIPVPAESTFGREFSSERGQREESPALLLPATTPDSVGSSFHARSIKSSSPITPAFLPVEDVRYSPPAPRVSDWPDAKGFDGMFVSNPPPYGVHAAAPRPLTQPLHQVPQESPYASAHYSVPHSSLPSHQGDAQYEGASRAFPSASGYPQSYQQTQYNPHYSNGVAMQQHYPSQAEWAGHNEDGNRYVTSMHSPYVQYGSQPVMYVEYSPVLVDYWGQQAVMYPGMYPSHHEYGNYANRAYRPHAASQWRPPKRNVPRSQPRAGGFSSRPPFPHDASSYGFEGQQSLRQSAEVGQADDTVAVPASLTTQVTPASGPVE